jgi:hypothetical protein
MKSPETSRFQGDILTDERGYAGSPLIIAIVGQSPSGSISAGVSKSAASDFEKQSWAAAFDIGSFACDIARSL